MDYVNSQEVGSKDVPWSVCLKTLVKLNVLWIVLLHSAASNANLTFPALVTGGSWKKSPVTMTYEPELNS